MNYDKTHQEYDVWTNHILARESDETYGLITPQNNYEFSKDERLAATLAEVNMKNTKKDFLTETKFKGDLNDLDLFDNEYDRFVKPITGYK